MLRKFVVPCLLVLSGCAGNAYDKVTASSFTPVSEDKFVFRAPADVIYTLDEEGEKVRITWLEEYLHDNGFCSRGYKITDRRFILKHKALLADVGDVIYRGECVKG